MEDGKIRKKVLLLRYETPLEAKKYGHIFSVKHSGQSFCHGFINIVIERCCAKIAKTLLIFNNARTEYCGGHTVDCEKTKLSCSRQALPFGSILETESLTQLFRQKICAECCVSRKLRKIVGTVDYIISTLCIASLATSHLVFKIA